MQERGVLGAQSLHYSLRAKLSSEWPVIVAELSNVEQGEHGRRDIGEPSPARSAPASVRTSDGVQRLAVWAPVRGEHVLGVAVIGRDHAHPALPVDLLDDLTQTFVHGLHGENGRWNRSGVSDHVGVGEVEHRKARVFVAEPRQESVGDIAGAHLWLVVIGGHVALGWDQLPLFACERLPTPPLKK